MPPTRLRHGLLALAAALLAACGGSVDREDPTATLTAPLNGASGLSGPLTLSADASDNERVAGVEFQIDGVGLGDVTAPPYTLGLDTGAFVAGQHILRTRARDEGRRHSPWSSATVSFASARSVPAGFEKNEAFVTGVTNATAFAQAPDGRLFIAQQTGELRLANADGSLLAAPLLRLVVDANGERGLIGVALHPDFASNGFVYLHYTTPAGGTHNRISRFTVSGDGVSGSEQVLVELPVLSSATNHNGGALHFGADGKLYVGVGDNANGANAKDLSSPFGKLLRFNDDGSIPEDNPNARTQSGLAGAVWAAGLRNPFSFAFEPGGGRLYINDVGENAWEEVDIGAAGANYGWPDSEGPTSADGITAPRFAYPHQPSNPPGVGPGGFFVGTAITGGAFYPASGGNFPAEYARNYFFADFGARFIARLDPANDDAAYAFASVTDMPVDLLVGSDGALYVLTRSGVTRIAVPS
jgi:glucose/arabinose dehydrogenase